MAGGLRAVEVALFRHGFSMQGEHHWKRVEDCINDGRRRLRGGYPESGFFPMQGWSRRLAALEVAGLVAYVDPDVVVADDFRQEYSAGVYWYFNQTGTSCHSMCRSCLWAPLRVHECDCSGTSRCDVAR